MKYLKQNRKTGYWTDIASDDNIYLAGVHNIMDCRRPCAIHNTASRHALFQAPLLWNESRGLLQRLCKHNYAHIDYDLAMYYHSINQTNSIVHTCDGCCGIN